MTSRNTKPTSSRRHDDVAASLLFSEPVSDSHGTRARITP